MGAKSEAFRLLNEYTRFTGNIDLLYGPGGLSCRKHVLEVLQGRPMTAKDAGWNRWRESIVEAAGIDRAGKCVAEVDSLLREVVKSH